MHLLKQYKRDDGSIAIFVGAAGLFIQLRDDLHNISWHVRGYPISFVDAIREVCGSRLDATGTVDDYPQTSAEFAFIPGQGDESEWIRAFWIEDEHGPGGGGWRMILRISEIRWIADFLYDYWVI